jgi:hypothetical protein
VVPDDSGVPIPMQAEDFANPLIETCDWKRVERGDSGSEDHVTEDFDLS